MTCMFLSSIAASNASMAHKNAAERAIKGLVNESRVLPSEIHEL